MLPGVEPAAAGAVDEDDRRAVPRGGVPPAERQPVGRLVRHLLVRDGERLVDRLAGCVRDVDRRADREEHVEADDERADRDPGAAGQRRRRDEEAGVRQATTMPSPTTAAPPTAARTPVKSLSSASSMTAWATCIAPATAIMIPRPTASTALAPAPSRGYTTRAAARIAMTTIAATTCSPAVVPGCFPTNASSRTWRAASPVPVAKTASSRLPNVRL